MKCFYRQNKSVLCRYCLHNVKNGIQIQVYNIINDSVNHPSQFISVKVKKNLRKSQDQFREKLRKLRLRQNNDFLIKKTCTPYSEVSKIYSCVLIGRGIFPINT